MASSGSSSSSYRWVILGVGTSAQGVLAAVFVAVPVLAPALRVEYHLSLHAVGGLLAAATGGQVLTQYVWGLLNDRFGERVVLAAGMGAGSVALVFAALTTRLLLIAVALVFAGMFATAVSAATGRAIMGWFEPGERGLALGVRQTAVPAGGAVAAAALPFALDRGGLGASFFVLAGACATVAVLGALLLREPQVLAGQAEGAGADPLRDGRLWRLMAGGTLLIFVQAAFLAFVVLYLHVDRGLSTARAAAVLAAINIAGGGLRVWLGLRSDRRHVRLEPLSRVSLVIAAASAATVGATTGSNVILIPVLFVAGAVAISWNGLLVAATAELVGRTRTGTALGLQQTALSATVTVVGPAFAAIVTLTSWRTGFAFLAVLPLGAYLILRTLVPAERVRCANYGRPT